MQVIMILLLCIATATFSGCATIRSYPERSGNLQDELKEMDKYYSPKIIDDYNKATDKQAFRDEVVNARVRAIDLHFGIFQQAFARESMLTNVGADWAVLALSGAGAVVPSASTKTIFAAISGGITGAKGSIDKNVYFNKTMPVLLSKMEALRKDALVRIRSGLELDIAKYPLTQALIDLEDYYQAGTIPGALMGITATSGAEIKESDKELKDIFISKYKKDVAGDLLRKFWKPNGKDINKDNEEKLKKWMEENKIKVSITSFLRSSTYNKEREKALEYLTEKGE